MSGEPAGGPGSVDPTARTPFEADLVSTLRRVEVERDVYREILLALGYTRKGLALRIAGRFATLKTEARSL